ncbi:hypothetical protein TWF694_011564 [Orbilia ellipsospora]|uniref:Uncharacterized protein n=1 Tax=Orbilia ellipsospora TaxID=2528407 RepID=A0AAV9X5V8_9PEZI
MKNRNSQAATKHRYPTQNSESKKENSANTHFIDSKRRGQRVSIWSKTFGVLLSSTLYSYLGLEFRDEWEGGTVGPGYENNLQYAWASQSSITSRWTKDLVTAISS